MCIVTKVVGNTMPQPYAHFDMQSKYWCFTLNNYTPEDRDRLDMLVEKGECSYLVFGDEVGESGTPHYQGYIEFPRRRRLNQVKALVSPRAHLDRRKGSGIQAAEYCKKDGRFWEYGSISVPRPGRRTDLDEIRDIIKGGGSLEQVVEEHFGSFARYHRGIKAAFSLLRNPTKKSRDPPEVYVYWGDTGTGKTRSVYDENTVEEIWVYPGNNWFDGYIGQSVALFDEFSGSSIALTTLLRILDRYPMTVPVKGDHVNWNPKKVYLTSNLDPSDWYQNAHPQHVAALRRRFTSVRHFQ